MKRVLIIAGGTGGHIYPALTIAKELQQRQVEVHWLGSQIGLEQQIIPAYFPLYCIAARRFRGKGSLAQLMAPFWLLKATWQAWRIIRRVRPDVILAMGGYVSVPGGIATKLAAIPLVIHEQNAIAGYSNRLLVRLAKFGLAAYPNAFPKSVKVDVVGNPVRPEIIAMPAPQERFVNEPRALRLLILGGSQGAKAVNQHMVAALRQFQKCDQLEIWHQTGQLDYEEAQKGYESFKDLVKSVKVTPFIENMIEAYQWADLVISRSGASTVAEIMAVGIASILIPFPYAVDDHQWYNGYYLQQVGAAILIRQNILTTQVIEDLLNYFLADRTQLLQMAEKARSLAQPLATTAVIEILEKSLQ